MMTTMVGSYPKVAEGAYSTKLIGAVAKWQRQELTDAQLEQVHQDLTAAVIKEQEEAGLDLLTDGQIRWEDLVTPFAKGIEGFEINGLERWLNNNVYYRRPILRSKPVWRRPIFVEAYRTAARVASRPVKAVLPGPYTLTVMSEDRYFKTLRRMVLAMAELLHQEAAALASAGAPFIQFDEPAVGFGKPAMPLVLEAIGVAAKGLKAKTALYTYFGTLNGALAPLMRSAVDVVGVDVVSDPAALKALARARITKELAVGCVDGRNTKLEPVAQLRRCIGAVAKRVPADRLYINPNCGLEFLPHEQAVAKLRRMVEAVHDISDE